MKDAKTVGDYLAFLKEFPEDMPVHVATQAGGGISLERRDVKGVPSIAIFGTNGGRFGESPLTEEEYAKKSKEFLSRLRDEGCGHGSGRGWVYTTSYGDHRLYQRITGTGNDGCYGTSYDERIIDRMVAEGKLEYFKQDFSRDGVRLLTTTARQ